MVSEAIPYLYPNTKDIFLRTKVRDILFDGLTIHCSAPEVGKDIKLRFLNSDASQILFVVQ